METHHHLETVYVVGTHDEFVSALGDKIEELFDKTADAASVAVRNVSHALAIDGDGRMHWSAIIDAHAHLDEDEEE